MNREAQILQALQGELPLAARKALVVELNSIRSQAEQRVAAAREVELGKEAAAAHLTPAPTYVRHTSDTDWLGKVGSVRQAPAEIHQQAKSEAGAWMRQVSALARADHEELRVQAVGYAQVWGSQFGELATVARDSFLQTASHLAGVKLAADDEDEPKDDDDSDEAYTEADDPYTLGSPRSSSLRTAAEAYDWRNWVGHAYMGFPGSEIVSISPSTDYLMNGPRGTGPDHQAPATMVLRTEDGRELTIPIDLATAHRQVIGARRIASENCSRCGGSGAVNWPSSEGSGTMDCPKCKGTGQVGSNKESRRRTASPDFSSYPKGRAQGQEWSTTCSECGETETGTDYYNGWPSQDAFHRHLFCGPIPDGGYQDQDLAIDRYSSLRTAEWEAKSCARCGGNNSSGVDRCAHCGAVMDPSPKRKAGLYPDENAPGVTTWADGYGNWHATADSMEEAEEAIRQRTDNAFDFELVQVGPRHYTEDFPDREASVRTADLNYLSPADLSAEQARVEASYVGRRVQRVTDGVQGTVTAVEANPFGGNPRLTIEWDDGAVTTNDTPATVINNPRSSSRKHAEADGIESPSPDSQNGYAESTLPDVTPSSAPEDTNLGWISEGDPNADNAPNGTDTSITASLGVFEAMFMSAKTASFDGVPDCIQYFAPGRIVVDASRKVAADPGWLRERVNDPYGTPNRVQGPDGQMVDNPFWTSVDYEDVGDFRVFEKDGQWYAHHRRQNYWMKIKNRAEADTLNGSLDMNASRKAAREGWWPLVPSSKYPGENDLVCPDCGSPDVSISGNNLGRDILRNNLYTTLTCNSCGRRDVLDDRKSASRKHAEADGIDSPSPQSQNGYAESTLPNVEVATAPEDTNLGWITDGDPNADDEAAFEAPDNPIANEASRTAAGPAGFWCPKCKKYQSTRTPAQLKAAREHVPNCQGKKESSLDAHFARLVEAGKAYDKGMADGKIGDGIQYNPYPFDSQDGAEWIRGYRDAQGLQPGQKASSKAGKAYDKGMADGKIGDGIQYNPYPFDSQDGAEWIRGYRDAQGLQPGQKASSKTAGENDRPAGAAPMVDQVTDEPEDDTDMFGGEWAHDDEVYASDIQWQTRTPSRTSAMHPDDDPSQGPGYLNDAPNLLGDPPGMDPEDYDMFAPELPKQARKTAMPAPADLGINVGDIFYNSWGYDQTNIDYYKVVRLTPAGVEIVPIGKKYVERNGPGGDQVVPDPDSIRDYDTITGIERGGKGSKVCRIKGDGGRYGPYIVLNDRHSATRWNGRPDYQTDSMFGH